MYISSYSELVQCCTCMHDYFVFNDYECTFYPKEAIHQRKALDYNYQRNVVTIVANRLCTTHVMGRFPFTQY